MKKKILVFMFVSISLLFFCSKIFSIDNARLLRSPDIKGDKIAFVYAGDLWTVSVKGGDAVRLTSHPGYESGPVFSPGGKWIAFTAEYDGNVDVFLIPSEGGEPKRLTYHPMRDEAVGWSPDGKFVIFNSYRELFSRTARLFKIAVDGVFPERMPFPQGVTGSYSPDGKYYAYNPLSSRVFRAWRRYRGGTVPYIWIFNFADNSVKMIPHPKSNDVYPRWVGEKILFLSDRDRVMNLYSYHFKNGILKQVTRFEGADIKMFGADKDNVIFEREGYLHLLNLTDSRIKKLNIDIPNELLNRRPKFVKAGRLIFNFDISPTGKRAVFGARGEIVTVPAKKGDIRNLTNTPCKMERKPVWSPDGEWIAFFGEEEGEYVLKIVSQKGFSKPRMIKIENPSIFYDLVWSPDSKKLAFNDVKQNLYYVEVNTKKIFLVDKDPYFLNYPYPSWSPDSQWIVYSKLAGNRLSALFLYSLNKKKVWQITDGMSSAYSPVFDRGGKYIYFAASTDTALDTAWLDMSEYPHNPTSNLYAVVLSKDEPSPFKPESDEEGTAQTRKVDTDKPKKKEDKKVKKEDKKVYATKIDIQGIEHRIVSIDIPTRRYWDLQAGAEGILYYLNWNFEKRNFDLYMYDMKKRKEKALLKKIDSYSISADGKKMLYRSKRYSWFIVDAGKKPKSGDGLIKTSAIETYSVPALEYRQMLYEAWRINRDLFYDPGMHGQDWEKIWKQYETYLPYIAHRSDLTYIIGQMQGEYTCGHAYAGGGMYPKIDRVSGGLLGADYEIIDGFYRIKKIYFGENWNPKLRSPLTEPGINVNEGDFMIEVNGKKLTTEKNIYSYFQKTAGKQVVIKVNNKPEATGARTYTVVPVAREYSLRHRQWIEENRKKVENWSGGKVGYVYLPNTSVSGFTYFHRYFFAHLDKEAMIFDERFNGGGYAADYIINMLNRPLLSWWQPRYGKPFYSPNNASFGPKVMIINEHAGSGGDYMPWAFRQVGLGKLVGKRTWGGLVGISGYPPLMDGGYVTAPSFAFVDKKGEFSVENEGVEPDIEVEITPADFIAGRDPQLKKAVEVVLEELKKNPPPKFKRKSYPRGR